MERTENKHSVSYIFRAAETMNYKTENKKLVGTGSQHEEANCQCQEQNHISPPHLILAI